MPKGVPNKKYSGEYKQMVVEYMRENELSSWQVEKEFGLPTRRVQNWERIYLEEGAEGLYVELRGRANASSGAQTETGQAGGGRPYSRKPAIAGRGGILKKLASLGFGKRATPAQKAQVIGKLRQEHSLAVLLSVAKIPRSTYY